MKKQIVLAAMALSVFGLASCSDNDDEIAVPAAQQNQLVFNASAVLNCGDNGLSKAALQFDKSTVFFSPNEEISVNCYDKEGGTLLETATFKGDNAAASATAKFTGTVSASTASAAKYFEAFLPASNYEAGVMDVPTVQAPEANGFAPKAFLAKASTSSDDMAFTFNADVAFLKIKAGSYHNIRVSTSDGTNENNVAVPGLETGRSYYVALKPGNYSTISISGVNSSPSKQARYTTLKDFSNKELKAGYYYTVDICDVSDGVTFTASTLMNFPKSGATKIVFDYAGNVDVDALGLTQYSTVGSDVIIYSNSGWTVFYLVSNKNICLSGSLNQVFQGLTSLTTLDFNNFHTDNVADFSEMFQGCTGLTSLDLSGFNTATATNMSMMFNACSALKEIDLSSFNTEKVENMSNMFSNMSALTSIDLSSFNTSKVINMSNMFVMDQALTTIYASDAFSVGKVTSDNTMFAVCTALKGGAGTTFSWSLVGKGGAHIDDSDNPGYFTKK